MINKRALILTGVLLLVFAVIVARLFSIQIAKHELYTLVADHQQNNSKSVKAERGLIQDVNGEVLSFTRDNVSFFVDTRMMNPKRVDSITAKFSKILGKPKEYYKKIINDGVGNVCLEKKVTMDKAIELKKMVMDGFFFQEDFSRVYPYGSLASHVLGYVNKENVGVEGLEKVYHNKLIGTDGVYVFERDVMGRPISVDEKQSKAARPGNTLTLTINKTYQKILEEEIAAGMKKFQGESAVGIIMNPNTGEILALTNSPDFDPANYEIFPADARRNRAITDTYEPGSTMKSISFSILFDQNMANENEIIDTENGRYLYKGAKILDTHDHAQLTVKGVLEQSSNIGMAKLSLRIPDDVFYKYLRDFGFSNASAIDLPSEAAGTLKKPSNFTGITKPFMSFGYELGVTPLQMISAYSALVNGGTLYQPYVVKQITDCTGKVLEVTQPTKIRTVINKSTSDKMRELLVGVVEHGTGTIAQLENVLVGGKTGTAQRLVNNSYSSSHHNSSFIGFFPADNPKVVCFILVNAPKIGSYGGVVAAPIFHEVAKRMIETDVNLVPNKKPIERQQNFVNQFIADVKSAPKSTSKSYLDLGEKENKKFQPRNFFNGKQSAMPNLVNQSIRDAVAQLNELGVQYKIVGTGKVIWQSMEPGTNIVSGSVCNLKCEPLNKKNTASVNQ